MPKKTNTHSRKDLERELRAARAKIISLHLEIAEYDDRRSAKNKADHRLLHLIKAFNALPASAYNRKTCLERFGTCPPPPLKIPRALRRDNKTGTRVPLKTDFPFVWKGLK